MAILSGWHCRGEVNSDVKERLQKRIFPTHSEMLLTILVLTTAAIDSKTVNLILYELSGKEPDR